MSGKSTVAEQKELLEWLRQDDNLAEYRFIKDEWKQEVANESISAEYYGSWRNIQNNLFGQMQSNIVETQRILNFFRYAAIFLLLISIPSMVYIFLKSKANEQLVYTSVVADCGQISKVVLPDSSVIWVNAGSTIKYNNRYSATNRDIDLIGEAFFKVKGNLDIPFVVSSSNLRVKVLGTEFSVSAYPEEANIHVVLEKGKVELTSAADAQFRCEMKPGELATFHKRKRELAVSSVNTDLYTSWKDGLINIYNLPLSALVIKLEKRYNQKFKVDDAVKNLPYTFTIKNEDLSSVLSLMERITPIEVIQRDNIIELRNKKNNRILK